MKLQFTRSAATLAREAANYIGSVRQSADSHAIHPFMPFASSIFRSALETRSSHSFQHRIDTFSKHQTSPTSTSSTRSHGTHALQTRSYTRACT